MFKVHAPGAKTFLQVIRARFGKKTHVVFCCFAFFTNLVVTLMLMLGGTAVLTSLVQGLSPELASMLLAIIIGSYTLIGGVGATFYVSYFNCAIMFIIILVLIVEIFYNPYGNANNPFGSSTSIYQFVTCWKAPDSNAENSYMTFYSSRGLIFGIINIVGNFGAVFCDQAYWQSSVAAKPIQVKHCTSDDFEKMSSRAKISCFILGQMALLLIESSSNRPGRQFVWAAGSIFRFLHDTLDTITLQNKYLSLK